MNDSDEDQRLPHMTDPLRPVSLEELKEKTGMEYLKVNADDHLNDEALNQLKKERGYSYEDVCNITEQMPEYQKKIKSFFEEHIHSDEEIRLILDGCGYFDARDKEDQWIRVEVTKGDMLILPAGIYHRFTLDTSNRIVAKRYFVGEPVWTPINRGRPADEHPARGDYLKMLGVH